MKILYSCLSKSWGGMEMFTLTAVEQLIKRNNEVKLLCIRDSRIHIEASSAGILTHAINFRGYFNTFEIIKCGLTIRKEGFDLIHTQASKDLWLLVPALKIFQLLLPLFFTKQVGSFIRKKDFLHNLIYKRVNKAFAISNVIKENLLETTALTENKIILLHNGIDTEKFDPEKVDWNKVRSELNIAKDEIVIGMLARFSPGKGHEEFLSAAKKLNEKSNNLRFVIVGEASRGEDEYAKRIKLLASQLMIQNILFTGFRSDTPEVLAAMDIFIFPSHSEAFGIALVEAMALAKPSVCSNSDGVLDIAVEGETSFLFENKNADDLANKILKLILDPKLRIEMGKQARHRVVNNFDLKILTERVIDFYKEEIDSSNE